MLDQNTVTIIASLIAVFGTLAGSVLGVVLSNRHSSKMEKLRIEQENKTRKLAKTSEAIEEVYTTVNQLKAYFDQFTSSNTTPKFEMSELSNNLPQEIRSSVDRVRTLVNLYIPSVKGEADQFLGSISGVWSAYCYQRIRYFHEQQGIKIEDVLEISNHFTNALAPLTRTYSSLQSALENLVQ